MSIDREFVLTALLGHNYLPMQRRTTEEMPPIFSTTSFTPEVARKLSTIKARKGAYSGYDQTEYRLTRFNSVCRTLSMPHPLPHAKLCLKLCDHWDAIDYIVSNPSSQIKPQQYSDGRLVIMNGYSDSVEKANRHLSHAFGKLYKVKSDISNCFASIYSHAVPWALVGHDEAKRNKSEPLEWYNQIDKALRACRRDETQGIAIGPGTSSVISEIILARIDKVLRDDDFEFTRYIDDYTCHCANEEHAQEFIQTLERETGRYKLQLNIKKTEISRLPQPISDYWVIELSRSIPSTDSVSTYQAFQYLDAAVGLSVKYPGGSVLKFATKKILTKTIQSFGDNDLLNYLLTLAYQQPVLLACLDNLINSCAFSFFDSPTFHSGAVEKLNAITLENTRRRQSDGVCWALYYLGQYDSPIDEAVADAVIQSRDAFSILTLYWTTQHQSKAIAFCEALDPADLYELDRYWVLLYQLYRDGVIADPYADDVFGLLKAESFTLLNPKIAPSPNYEAVEAVT